MSNIISISGGKLPQGAIRRQHLSQMLATDDLNRLKVEVKDLVRRYDELHQEQQQRIMSLEDKLLDTISYLSELARQLDKQGLIE